ncbi:FMN-binding protein [Streptomyces nigra]|uniref:FMN-binding protein n=1 Tax=Streptomyces nigra TaxID=1827580 RepID=UPI0037F492FF
MAPAWGRPAPRTRGDGPHGRGRETDRGNPGEAQDADIDTVSGATITSDGYKESLQAAMDAKG